MAGMPTTLSLEPETEDEVSTDAPAMQVGQITVDIYEVDNYYEVRAPIAGVRLAALDIVVDGKTRTIRGQSTIPSVFVADTHVLQY